jgi:hypothetical protein
MQEKAVIIRGNIKNTIKSLAKIIKQEECLILLHNLLVHILNNTGPNTEPWKTPEGAIKSKEKLQINECNMGYYLSNYKTS